MPAIRYFLALALIICAAGQQVRAGAFSVVPQTIQLSVEQRSSMVEVRNNAEVETIFQVETFAWVDSVALEDLSPTRDILAVPAVFRLAPGASQTVRIAARGRSAPAANEQSYRLLISEVPSEQEGGGVVFALRMSLPVFLTPIGAKPDLAVELIDQGQRVQLKNQGQAHLRLREVRAVDRRTGAVLEVLPLTQPAYLLPGRSRQLALAADVRRLGVMIEADTSDGSFQHNLSD